MSPELERPNPADDPELFIDKDYEQARADRWCGECGKPVKPFKCPKCGAEPKEFWYDGSCIEHGRPEMVPGRMYYLRYEGEWTRRPWEYIPESGFADDLEAWLPIPTVEELLLTTKGKV